MKFYAFYVYAIGGQPKIDTFDSAEQVEEFYKKVMENAALNDGRSDYCGLTIIYGEQCVFEPVEVVTRWRLKE